MSARGRVPVAAYKDLCVDAVDAPALARFWGDVLDLRVRPREDGVVALLGPTPQHTVWVNPVPEPVTVKQRVHLDVHAGDVRDVLTAGATPLDLESFRWKVLRDPEGGELCAFERDEVPSDRLYEIVVDSADPERVARWWAGVLGGRLVSDGTGEEWAVEDVPGAPFECLVFGAVPEPKTVKNRIHLDVTTPNVSGLVEAGATVLRHPDGVIRWTVLSDPEGNEFCAFGDR
ncbi:VOC family protein [Nocardioides panaciterrulae]|uniref:Glyoxalase-like domain-containing protein n=1 Tax=Nocardioides panaciterrulae TaxID=661492 RepID=A0A7Y9E9L5_9ACTN|nr:hypothetical protein [Nocardioides panaciterrulae]